MRISCFEQGQDKGDGIARIEGFVVFVGNATVGKKIRIKVTEVADRFAKAIIV
jgi:predicted RNA-binding protein with TRAM domain